MKTPINAFKQALKEKRTQYGLWVSLLGPLNTEICAAAGFLHRILIKRPLLLLMSSKKLVCKLLVTAKLINRNLR